MFGKKFLAAFSIAAVCAFAGFNSGVSAKGKKTGTFKVKIENISDSNGVTGENGNRYPFALSPGLFVVDHKDQYFFNEGKAASKALETQAEDGNPELLSKKLLPKVGSIYSGVFNMPLGSDKAGPLLPGNSFEFEFTATEGMKLNLIAMYGQSNDLFYSMKAAVDLFDKNGDPLKGDITDKLLLWDAGTEVNQAPGEGSDQAPRQSMANTGKTENGVVQLVKDGFTYPKTTDVLRVTVTAQ